MGVTNFVNGISTDTAGEVGIFGAFPVVGNPTRTHTYFNDFDNYVSGDWVVVETAGGATQATGTGDGGLLVLTNTTGNTDANYMQLGAANTFNSFLMAAGKKAVFETRLKIDAAVSTLANVAVIAGLHVSNSTDLAPTDGIYFIKPSGAATVNVICRKNASTGSTTATSIATMVDDTFITLSWYYDGIDKVYYAVDGVIKGYLDGSSSYLPDTAITVSFGQVNATTGAANVLTVDYVYAAKER